MATARVGYGSYREKAAELLRSSDRLLVAFVADDDVDTGLPWCPDCARAVPVIEAFAKERKLPLLEVLVGQRPEWKTPSHPLKSDLELPVLCVPTVALLNKELKAIGPVYGSELENARGADEVAELLDVLVQLADTAK